MHKPTMKNATTLIAVVFSAALFGIVSGCATMVQTEDLLTGAGFKARPAITAEQQAQLKSLPARKVSSVQKDGKTYFVYPDAARNVVYIGQNAEYQRYKQLRK